MSLETRINKAQEKLDEFQTNVENALENLSLISKDAKAILILKEIYKETTKIRKTLRQLIFGKNTADVETDANTDANNEDDDEEETNVVQLENGRSIKPENQIFIKPTNSTIKYH